MSSRLKDLHPYLHKRVWNKGVIFTLLGLSGLFSKVIDPFVGATQRNQALGLAPEVTAIPFLAIGVMILTTLYSNRKFNASRKFLLLAFLYAAFWEIALVALAFLQNINTVAIFLLWGYLTRNMYLVLTDPAWDGAKLVQEIRSGEA